MVKNLSPGKKEKGSKDAPLSCEEGVEGRDGLDEVNFIFHIANQDILSDSFIKTLPEAQWTQGIGSKT